MFQTLEEQVQAFLSAHREQAFTAIEVALAIDPNYLLYDPSAFQVNAVLADLINKKALEGRYRDSPRGKEYFFAQR
jgi:hypothetical protein